MKLSALSNSYKKNFKPFPESFSIGDPRTSTSEDTTDVFGNHGDVYCGAKAKDSTRKRSSVQESLVAFDIGADVGEEEFSSVWKHRDSIVSASLCSVRKSIIEEGGMEAELDIVASSCRQSHVLTSPESDEHMLSEAGNRHGTAHPSSTIVQNEIHYSDADTLTLSYSQAMFQKSTFSNPISEKSPGTAGDCLYANLETTLDDNSSSAECLSHTARKQGNPTSLVYARHEMEDNMASQAEKLSCPKPSCSEDAGLTYECLEKDGGLHTGEESGANPHQTMEGRSNSKSAAANLTEEWAFADMKPSYENGEAYLKGNAYDLQKCSERSKLASRMGKCFVGDLNNGISARATYHNTENFIYNNEISENGSIISPSHQHTEQYTYEHELEDAKTGIWRSSSHPRPEGCLYNNAVINTSNGICQGPTYPNPEEYLYGNNVCQSPSPSRHTEYLYGNNTCQSPSPSCHMEYLYGDEATATNNDICQSPSRRLTEGNFNGNGETDSSYPYGSTHAVTNVTNQSEGFNDVPEKAEKRSESQQGIEVGSAPYAMVVRKNMRQRHTSSNGEENTTPTEMVPIRTSTNPGSPAQCSQLSAHGNCAQAVSGYHLNEEGGGDSPSNLQDNLL